MYVLSKNTQYNNMFAWDHLRGQQKAILIERLREVPRQLIVVTGPRQTGKTTLVRQALAEIGRPARYVPIDEPDSGSLDIDRTMDLADVEETTLRATGVRDERWLVDEWERCRGDLEGSGSGIVLALDEIQKIPNWSEVVKGLWDADRLTGRNLHVILLGSAPLLVQRGTSESLAGRYETMPVTHWTFPEMSAAFGLDLSSYIYFGGYPGSARFIHDQERWRAYILGSLVEPNIERDILAMERVGQAGTAQAVVRAWSALFRADPVLYQDARPAPRRRQYHDTGAVPGPPFERRSDHRSFKVHGKRPSPQGFKSQADRAQYGAHGRIVRVYV